MWSCLCCLRVGREKMRMPKSAHGPCHWEATATWLRQKAPQRECAQEQGAGDSTLMQDKRYKLLTDPALHSGLGLCSNLTQLLITA